MVDIDWTLLLYRFQVPAGGPQVWAPPGGGLEGNESALDALHRELYEEIGLRVDGHPKRVWHQRVVSPDVLSGWDGVINDFYLVLVPSARFEPQGTLASEDLEAGLLGHFVWWSSQQLLDYSGTDLFTPRDLPRLFAELVQVGPPSTPIVLGW